MNYTVTQIEAAMESAITASETLAYLKEVMILPSLDLATLEALAWRGPAVGVIGLSGEYKNDINGITDEDGDFAVVALNKNLRSSEAATGHGALGEKGTWDIIADCRTALKDNRLDLDINGCIPLRRSLLFASDRGAGCILEVKVSWRHTH